MLSPGRGLGPRHGPARLHHPVPSPRWLGASPAHRRQGPAPKASPPAELPQAPRGSLCSGGTAPCGWGHWCPHPLLRTHRGGTDGSRTPVPTTGRQGGSWGPSHTQTDLPRAASRDTPEPSAARSQPSGSPGQSRAPVLAAGPPSPSSFVPHGFQLPWEQRACCSQQHPGRANKGRQLFCHTKASFTSKPSTSPSLWPGRAAVRCRRWGAVGSHPRLRTRGLAELGQTRGPRAASNGVQTLLLGESVTTP